MESPNTKKSFHRYTFVKGNFVGQICVHGAKAYYKQG